MKRRTCRNIQGGVSGGSYRGIAAVAAGIEIAAAAAVAAAAIEACTAAAAEHIDVCEGAECSGKLCKDH